MKSIERILIANRGEIAIRIARTCRAMGISTVAVFSDADADAPFVRAADEAVRIGPPAPSESYLRADAIIEAARATGADAIHPGYGFLAENADFAAACAEAGLIFIGPAPDVIRLLGSKRESKKVVADAGVPVIPGYNGDDQDDATLRARAEEVGYPLLLKASAGGGGKGMRVVTEESGLDAAIAGAKREAKSAFGDDTLLVERYVDRPRHVEIQILGDQHGNLVHLFERECSIQRRHQKIIEETPSTALDDDLRRRMGEAAVKVGAAVGYTNAGTVEFILAPDGEFYFLEVNTRLQVEHPVTEMVTGLDLVREQIRVAQGETLGLGQDDLVQRGAALECRLYAEDPDNGFLPTTGRLADWHLPDLPGLRVDTGVESGAEISIHYDPMIAKVVCYAPTRSEAIRAMIYSLENLSAPGVVTNRDYLVRVLRHPAFAAGELDTHFVDTHGDALRPVVREGTVERAAAVATAFDHELGRRARTLLPGVEPGFRLEGFGDEHVTYAAGDQQVTVRYRNAGDGQLRVDAGELSLALQVVSIDGPEITVEEAGRRRRYRVVARGDRRWVVGDGAEVALALEPRFPIPGATGPEGACVAPMPGKVVKVLVSASQPVEAGTPLLILEAMKMEHTIAAPEEGVVAEIAVAEGDQVDADAVLVVVAPRE